LIGFYWSSRALPAGDSESLANTKWFDLFQDEEAGTRQNPPLTASARKGSKGEAHAETMDYCHISGQLVDGL
jgi:hypothetical protein